MLEFANGSLLHYVMDDLLDDNAQRVCCPVCGGMKLRKLYPSALSGERWIYQCQVDRYCFVWPKVTDVEMEAMYKDGYTADESWLIKNQILAHDYWKKVKRYLPDHASFRFLEIGGAYGFFTKLVQDQTQSQVLLIEPGERAATYAEDILHLSVWKGDLTNLPKDELFEVIFAGHVLEHVSDPARFWAQCREHLAPQGKIIFITPNAEAWKLKLLREKWGWAAPDVHLHFFSAAAAVQMLEGLGLQVTACKTIAARRAYPLILTQFLLEKFPVLSRIRSQSGTTKKVDVEVSPSPGRLNSIKQIIKRFSRLATGMEFLFLACIDWITEQPDEIMLIATDLKTGSAPRQSISTRQPARSDSI